LAFRAIPGNALRITSNWALIAFTAGSSGLRCSPSTVVNVGAGEGYYAVGFARRLPNAQVLAFDANEDELISVAELLGRSETNPIRRVATQRASSADSTNASQELVLLPGDHQAAITQILGGNEP